MTVNPIMLYDGRCLFCNGAALFILRFEKEPKLNFAALQSKAGKQLLERHHIPYNNLNSFVIIDENGKAHTKWSACLVMFRHIGGSFYYFGLIQSLLMPTFLGNIIYSIGWKYRRFILGKSEYCVRPDGNLKARTILHGDEFDEEDNEKSF